MGKDRNNFFMGLLCSTAIIGMVLLQCSCDNWRGRNAPTSVVLNEVLVNGMSDIKELEPLDKDIKQYIAEWGIKGASLAIVRNDSLVYAKGYGISEPGDSIQPSTLFRIASVSKLLTAVGIMTLCERGDISLESKVFGENGILGQESYSQVITDPRYNEISVRDLLVHTAGFGTGAGDPMFSTTDIILQNHLTSPPDNETLLKCVLKRRLSFEPGTGSKYSNLGYLILSKVIETVSGEDYETWMTENVLKPAGCYDMHIGGTFYEEKLPGETRYYPQAGSDKVPCYDGSGRYCERCYGGSDIRNLSGAGAWVCSVPELARLVCSIDGKEGVPDILTKESIEEMTAETDSVTFGIGWTDISADGIWTRTGTLASTTALIKYYPDGECWILVTNTGTWRGPRFAKWTSSLFRRSREKYSSLLPHKDMFHEN